VPAKLETRQPHKIWLFLICIFIFLKIGGCATPAITFSTDKKATISLVGYADASSDGQIIGEAPQSIEMRQLTDKFVKIWGPGLAPQFWVFTEVVGKDTSVAIKMEETTSANDDPNKDPKKPEDKDKKKGDEAKKNDNDKVANDDVILGFRLAMRAYHSLTAGDNETARKLADELKSLMPKVSASHIITGISHLQEGNKTAAAGAFEVAKTLDPKDADIEKLIEAVK
jgi:hypothetical protein